MNLLIHINTAEVESIPLNSDFLNNSSYGSADVAVEVGSYPDSMTEREPGTPWSSDPATLIEQVKAMAGEMDAADLRAFMVKLMATGSADARPFAQPEPPNRRRPRRDEVRTYRIRVDITGATPPIWRRMEVGSDLMLDDLHIAIQTVLGWTDSHLHRFGLGLEIWDHGTEFYLCPFDADEGEDAGVPEDQVRLDEVLVDAGDTLLYVYDYGDNWGHKIRLEAVSDRPDGVTPVVCIDGRRAGPPEDCGGVHGYEEMLSEAADPTSDEHADAVERMVHYFGGTDFDPSQFNLDDANAALEFALDRGIRAAYHSEKLGGLLLSVQGDRSGDVLIDVARTAQLDQTVEIDARTASTMMRRFTWLLQRVGDDGIKLTAAQYLPPVHVEAAMNELDMGDEWIGKGNREDMTFPVLSLREATQRLGLVRKYRGRLLLTKLGRRLRDDPVALWWHLAHRLPQHKEGSSELQAGLVALALVAAGHEVRAAKNRLLIAELLTDLGWRLSTGEPISELSAYGATRNTVSLLEHAGAFEKGPGMGRSSRPTPGGRALARAALSKRE